MDWTDQHRDLLQRLRPIIGPPALGRVDGTAAVEGDHGFVFLFNPNYRELDAEFALDETHRLDAMVTTSCCGNSIRARDDCWENPRTARGVVGTP